MSKLVAFLRLVPKNALSRAVGGALRGPWPKAVHQAAIAWFVRNYEVEVDEAERQLSEYSTFAEFFTRGLGPGARPIAEGDVLVSPCDGAIGASGRVEAGRALQAKGRPYDLAQFLGSEAAARRYEGGTFVTIYLAPFNYHRVHSPVGGGIREAVHMPGTLWPVNPPAVERVEDLFAVNERLATTIATDRGEVAAVMVGATCVGRIRMRYDEIVTNAGVDHGRRHYDPPIPVEKGDELGVFEMGSTVVLLLPAGVFDPSELELGRPVRMGESLGPLGPASPG